MNLIILNANLHAGPFILLCLDTVYNTFSFPKRHFLVTGIFGTIYMLINLVYTLEAHIIYQPIPWTTFLSYVLVIGAFGMTYFMHWLGGLVYSKFKQPIIEAQLAQSLVSTDFGNSSSNNDNALQEEQSSARTSAENTFPEVHGVKY